MIARTHWEGHCRSQKGLWILSEGDGSPRSVLSRGGKCANLIGFLWLVYGEKLRGGFGRQGGGHCISPGM